MKRIIVIVLIALLISWLAVAECTAPIIVIDRLDCTGFAIHQEGGEQDAEYWVGIRGDCGTFGFLYPPFRLGAGESYATQWPKEWTFCWINWVNCHRYGIFEQEPSSIFWYVDLALEGETIDTATIELPIPCGARLYLPLILKSRVMIP